MTTRKIYRRSKQKMLIFKKSINILIHNRKIRKILSYTITLKKRWLDRQMLQMLLENLQCRHVPGVLWNIKLSGNVTPM